MFRFPYLLSNRPANGGDVSLMRRPRFTTQDYSCTHCVRGPIDPRALLQLEGVCELENPVT
jgi:hypothetical protein